MDLEYSNEVKRLPDGSGETVASLSGKPVLTLNVPASTFVFAENVPAPTEKDADSLASFIEAAKELEREPFFGPDEKRTFSTGGNFQTFHLGDRFHFRSALISFRRIWQDGETSNFFKVYGILWRYAKTEGDRISLHWARGLIQQTENGGVPFPLKIEITGRDLVALWINTVFAHGGGDEKRRHKRADFDRYVAESGQGPLEYAFRSVVWQLGIQYINVSKINAEPMLKAWEQIYSLKPSFNIGSAFGVSTRERTREGHVIVRRASSEYAAEETFDQSLRRILDRQKFHSLQFVLKQLEFGDKNLVRIILKSKNFADLVAALGYELKIDEHVSAEIGEPGGSFRGFSGLFDGRRHSALRVYEMHLVTDQVGIEILTELLGELKNVLLSE